MTEREQEDNASATHASAAQATRSERSGRVRVAAVGDLLLVTNPSGQAGPGGPDRIGADVRAVFDKSDVLFGNLECTLQAGTRMIATEPRVIAEPERIRELRAVGFDVVTLANNHAFDCYNEGFGRLRALLDELGIVHFGAGDNLAEAAAEAVVTVNGLRIAFVGGVDRTSGATDFAQDDRAGVAPFELEQMAQRISALKGNCDHVVVSVHWGAERISIPSPAQVTQAHTLVDAGASLVLGHHPHTLQGLEMYKGAPIIYSLGNFIANEVPFTDGDFVRWNRTQRTGCVLLVELGCEGVLGAEQIPTLDSGEQIAIERTGFGARRIRKVNRAVSGGVTLRRYRAAYLWTTTVRPVISHLRWSSLKTLRPRHVLVALGRVFKSVRAK